MKVGLAFDLRPTPGGTYQCGEDHCAEWDSATTIDALEDALCNLGHDVVRLGNVHDLMADLRLVKAQEMVFNIAEGAKQLSREAQVPALLDALEIPYAFADPLTMCMCLHKAVAKEILSYGGVRTPVGMLAFDASDFEGYRPLCFPLIVKPSHEGTSKGIDAASLVFDEEALARRVAFIVETYKQGAIVERFVRGTEFTVGILGTGGSATVIGAAEIRLKSTLSVLHGVHEKERCEELVDYRVVEPDAKLAEAALRAYKLLGCRDAGRVDVIVEGDGLPTVLEVNPLPGLHPTHSDLPIITRGMGMGFVGLIERIVQSCAARLGSGVGGLSDGHLRSAVRRSGPGTRCGTFPRCDNSVLGGHNGGLGH